MMQVAESVICTIPARHYFKNIHGDVIFAFTSGKWRSSEYSYGAYGNEGVSYDAFSDPNPIRYSGQYYDYESGMTYLRARYYDPQLRRFISEDPYWDIHNMIYEDNENKVPSLEAILQSSNLYAYCMNNPVMYVDPQGESAVLACIIIGATVGAVVGGFAGAYVSKRTTGEVNGISVTIGVLGGATVGGLLGWGFYAAGASISSAGLVSSFTGIYKTLDEGVNFASKALTRMNESARHVPVQVLIEAIKNGVAKPDPQGTSSTMYYIDMAKGETMYTLEVLYDAATNTIQHFMYYHK